MWLFVADRRAVPRVVLPAPPRGERGQGAAAAAAAVPQQVSNLGLGTQTIQWLILQGSFFVISVYLQEVWGYNAITTGLLLTPAHDRHPYRLRRADRFAGRHPQRWLIVAGFLVTAVGMVLLLALVTGDSGVWTLVPGCSCSASASGSC